MNYDYSSWGFSFFQQIAELFHNDQRLSRVISSGLKLELGVETPSAIVRLLSSQKATIIRRYR
ncbi:MAG: hypothetical protein M1379_00260 [Firmicutes bacterium]|nr:hypothetical protein [Bacillota bacterium]